MMETLYLCDRKACKQCGINSEHCKHTTDIKHAVNFCGEETLDLYIEIEKENEPVIESDRTEI